MSNIIVRSKYQKSTNMKKTVSKTLNYIGNNKKADASIVDSDNLINDFDYYNSDLNLKEQSEMFIWNMNGDIDKKDELNKIINSNNSGIMWSLVISFVPEFSLENGLITKKDYYALTKNIIPLYLIDSGFNINNVSWYCSLHRDTKNPHLHINFFELNPTRSDPKIPYFAIYNLKSNITKYLIKNEEFYIARDKEFKNITGTVSLKNLSAIKEQRLFNDKYRKELNQKLLTLYEVLPKTGRLQYNSKNSIFYKEELDNVIEFILMSDNLKYSYNNYLMSLNEQQKKFDSIYGKNNKQSNYKNNQLNKLYSQIGNEILQNYKVYISQDKMENEYDFLNKNINKFKFKSNKNLSIKEYTSIAKGLNTICLSANISDKRRLEILNGWKINSNAIIDIDLIYNNFIDAEKGLSSTDFYKIMKKLNYNYDRYSKVKSKEFYRELNYKILINQANKHLMLELENENKKLVENLDRDLEVF